MQRNSKTTRGRALAGLGLLGAAAAPLALVDPATASSHREAPYITELPKVDATDFYMFNSYEPGVTDMVTLVANYMPLQDGYGGPNYFTMDPEARYDIHVDKDGDALEDITFRFRFTNQLKDIQLPVGDGTPANTKNVSVALRNVGPFDNGNPANLNEAEWFTLDVLQGPQGGKVSTPVVNSVNKLKIFSKPVDNIGSKSIKNYALYADSHVYDIDLPGGFQGRMFVGQRKDPFVVNLGETFDLVNTNPLGPVNGEQDDLADKNITSLILELPKAFLTIPGQPVIGAWTTAQMRLARVLKTNPSFARPTVERGPWVQVSRLGMPLVNEVVIGLKDKNQFNASRPFDDGQFIDYVTHPTLPELLEALFGVTAPNLFPRDDLVAAFVTGFQGLNANGGVGEMLRLNTDIPPTPAGMQSELGALGGDLAGFPNGRRPGDDVVDITLRVAMGALLTPAQAPSGQLPYTDGAFVDDSYFDNAFPYLRDPIPGAK